MLPWAVNRLQPRTSGPFGERKDMEQCAGGGRPDGFIRIMHGGFEIGNDGRIGNMAERTEGYDLGAGKWIVGQAQQQAGRPLAIQFGCLSHGKGGRGT